jgi:hypothetical protein
MRSFSAVVGAVAVTAAFASTAGANSLSYAGTVTPSDPVDVDSLAGNSGCGTSVSTDPSINVHYEFDPASPNGHVGGGLDAVAFCPSSSSYEVTIPAGSTFLPLVTSFNNDFAPNPNAAYTLTVSGLTSWRHRRCRPAA